MHFVKAKNAFLIQQFVVVLAQKCKQFGLPYPFHDLLFLRRKLYRLSFV
jgi:hypothetical protein